MCGIAGVFGEGDIETVERMLGPMIHRGPDDRYSVSGINYALGARRLSIVGVADGRQPLSNEDGTIWAVQNGELYNYPIKKEELLARNVKIRTHCDTEIIPHLYQEHGSDFVHQIDGMFAIALWDEKNQLGILARDRMGKKPLYYFERNGVIYFASEIKSLLAVKGFHRRIYLQALNHYLSFKHVPCPLTIFEGIYVLPPAHMLLFQPGREKEIRRYWTCDWSESEELASLSEEELSEILIERLRQGVKRRLMADVPIGFFLSGGIDSSLSTVLAAEMSAERIKTFTLTYKQKSAAEGKALDQKWARWTAQRYGTEHYEEEIEFSEFPQNLRKIIGCFDEPFSGTMSTYFLSSLIARHVKVAISGDGADEVFGSYLSHRLAMPLANYLEYKSSGNPDLITPYQSQPEYLSQLYESEAWKWRAKLFVYQDKDKKELFSADAFAGISEAMSASQRLKKDFCGLSATDPLNRVLEAEFGGIFADQVLTYVDRLSMAHSLEIRSAYLDTEFVEFAARLPGHLKIKNGQTKYLLKRAASKYFPSEMVHRGKEGFIMPITDWLLNDLQDYVRDTLSQANLSKHGIFNQAEIDRLIDELYRCNGDYRQGNKILSLIVFQEWFDQYMNGADAHQLGVPETMQAARSQA